MNVNALLEKQVMQLTESGCWIWMGALRKDGYGKLRRNGKDWRAHRWIYQQLKGTLKRGLELDHLCHTRCCVNPNHLEQVTHQVNQDRGLGRKRVFCPHGHLMNGDNLYIGIKPSGAKSGKKKVRRECRQCAREYDHQRHGYQGNPLNRNRTHCIHGHPFDEINTYRPPGRIKRVCRECRRQRKRDARKI